MRRPRARGRTVTTRATSEPSRTRRLSTGAVRKPRSRPVRRLEWSPLVNAADRPSFFAGYNGGSLSFLPGQKLSSCTCPGQDHPGPNVRVGRGAPEIDILEARASEPAESVAVLHLFEADLRCGSCRGRRRKRARPGLAVVPACVRPRDQFALVSLKSVADLPPRPTRASGPLTTAGTRTATRPPSSTRTSSSGTRTRAGPSSRLPLASPTSRLTRPTMAISKRTASNTGAPTTTSPRVTLPGTSAASRPGSSSLRSSARMRPPASVSVSVRLLLAVTESPSHGR